MVLKKIFFVTAIAIGAHLSAETQTNGVVNFSTCILESKYGKQEQEQMDKLKKQWSSLIEETEKELKSVTAKLDDQNYLDGLSPEAIDELKLKNKTLGEDLSKYQSQLYQILNQANYALLQKMFVRIAEASEKVASQKKLHLVINKEACFYYPTESEVTTQVVSEMDKTFDVEAKKKAAESTNASAQASPAPTKEVEAKQTVKAEK